MNPNKDRYERYFQIIGLFGGEIKLNLINIPTRAYKIIGIDNGSNG
jgi:hypothetical protein